MMAATVILYIILIGVAFYTYSLSQRNKRALCTIRANAVSRAEDTQEFLIDHPDGIPGITVEDLRRSIQTYRATAKALDDVDCTDQ